MSERWICLNALHSDPDHTDDMMSSILVSHYHKLSAVSFFLTETLSTFSDGDFGLCLTFPISKGGNYFKSMV